MQIIAYYAHAIRELCLVNETMEEKIYTVLVLILCDGPHVEW